MNIDVSELYNDGCREVRITSCSRAADTAELSYMLEDMNADAPFSLGDEVTLTDGDTVLFHGYLADEPTVSISAESIECNVKLSNIVAFIAATPYTEDQSFYGMWLQRSRMASAKSLISLALNTGMVRLGGSSANEGFSVNFDSNIKCPVGSGSQTCWDVVESCLHWVPNAVTWYNPTARLLTFRTAEGGSVLKVDLLQNKVKSGERELFTFAGCSSASFQSRRDLRPPVVALTWTGAKLATMRDIVIPSFGVVRSPFSFLYQIPNLGGGSVAESPEQKMQVQQAASQTMLVKGRHVPDGWKTSGNMKEGTGAYETWRDFWVGFSAMDALSEKKTSVGCLVFGTAIFEPVPVDDAFPKGNDLADDTEQPENYEAFKPSDMQKLYVLYQGQFPASSKAKDNVGGLKFCKGKLKQYVWLKEGKYAGTLPAKEWQEFFSGSFVAVENGKKVQTRYALLELDAIFINRRRKKFQLGTNKLDQSDEDYKEDENESGSATDEATYNDYVNAATDYYNATRKVYYDGSIVMHGVEGYDPSELGGMLNVSGARKEWESMNTPIVQAEYDPQHRTLTISTGSPEILSIDERVQRTLLGRQSNLNSGTSFVDPPSNSASGDGGGSSEDDETYPMIGPSISAQAVVTKTGKPLNPFQLYADDDGKWYLNEGTLPAPGGKVVNFETTEVTDIVGGDPDVKLSVRVEREKGTQNWVAVIRKRK